MMTISRLFALALVAVAVPVMTFQAAASVAEEEAPADQAAIAALVAIGQPIFEKNCSACHSRSGRGSIGPNFIGNDELADAPHVFHQITRGGDEMPPFGKKLTPEEVLAVGTYVRNAWGNAYGILTPENVVRE